MILWSVLLLFRFLLASIVIAVLPGLVLHLALFPRRQFDGAERTFLILSTSIAMSSLTALALLLTPVGVQLWSFTLLLLLIVLLLGVMAVVRHAGASAWRETIREATGHVAQLPRTFRTSRRNIELPLFLLAILILVGAALLRGESSTRVTEFYFPPEQLAAVMAQAQQPQTSLTVPFEITNGAAQPASFRVEVWSNGTKVVESSSIDIAAQGTAQATVEIPAAPTGETHALEFLLYSAEQPTAIAQLRLQRGANDSGTAARD